MMQITQADIERWEGFLDQDRGVPGNYTDIGGRTNFYVELFEITGVETALDTASISTFSGGLGGGALVANYVAARRIGDDFWAYWPGLGTKGRGRLDCSDPHS